MIAEDLEKVREMGPMMFGSDSSPYTGDGDDDDSSGNNRSRIESGAAVGAVVAEDMMDVDKLCEAFFGCVCVFHTSSFSDPAGVSGYSVRLPPKYHSTSRSYFANFHMKI